MSIRKLARRALWQWQDWRADKKVCRVVPERRETYRQEAQARDGHRPVEPIQRRRFEIVAARLRQEVAQREAA